MQDTTASGRPFRALTLVDTYARQCHAIEVARSLPSERIRVDTEPEFVSRALVQWAARQGIQLTFITPGKPMEHGHIERFKGTFLDECLNQLWFLDLGDAQQLIAAWRVDDIQSSHSALANLPPAQFAKHRRPAFNAPL